MFISRHKSHYQKFTPPFDIPDSWEWVRLEDIANIGTGATPSRGNKKYYGGNINWVSSSVTSKRYVYEPTDHITDLAIKETNCVIYPIGTLIMAMYGEGKTRGQLTELKIEAATNQACAAVQPLNIETKEFIKLYLLANYYHLRQLAEGGNQPNLNIGKICGLYLPFPPLKEQSRIVNEYSKFDKVINSIDNNQCVLLDIIANTKSKILELAMQGKLVPQDPTDEPAVEMLKRINPNAKIITDNPHYPKLPDNWVLTDIQSVCEYGNCETVSVENINNEDWVLELEDLEKESGKIIQFKTKAERAVNGVRHRFAESDILYSKLRTYLNKVLIAPESGFCSTEIIPIRCNSTIIPEYLCAWLRSPFFLAYTSMCCYGVKMPRLSTLDARKAIVPLPPRNEQQQIIGQIKEIYSTLDKISSCLNAE